MAAAKLQMWVLGEEGGYLEVTGARGRAPSVLAVWHQQRCKGRDSMHPGSFSSVPTVAGTLIYS